MKKIVDVKEEGYTLFIEKKMNDINCVAYETNKHMSGQEVGEILGISRAAVSQILKKSIKKIFFSLKNKNKKCNSVQIISSMAKLFNVKTNSQYKKLFKLFPKEVRKEIREEAYKNGYCKN